MNLRQKKIYDYIYRNGFASAEDLAEKFGTSAITIRRDFISMESERLLNRVHGGAVLSGDMLVDTHVQSRLNQHVEEKKKIAALAASLVRQNDTLFLDAGSSCLFLAELLPENRNITVITHSLNNIDLLRGKTGIRLICPGGEYDEKLGAFVGGITEEKLNSFHVDRSFVGAVAVSPETGCAINNITESNIKKTFISHARESYVLVDSSKFTAHAFYSIIPIADVRSIITDGSITEELVTDYKERGVEILVAR